MKSPMWLNATFFFLFVLLAKTLPSSKAINMFDENGNPMRSGNTYYMLPVDSGSGGGPTLAKTGGDKCPLSVVQDANSSSPGLPVRLSDALGIYYVAEDYPVRVEFVGENRPSCVPSPSWWDQVGQNLKMVKIYPGIKFKEYSGKQKYVIADCFNFDLFDCPRVISVNKTLVVSKSGKPWVVKFKRVYINSRRDSWTTV